MSEITLKSLDPITDEGQSREGHVSPNAGAPAVGLRRLRAEAEAHAIKGALEQTRWNRRRAAELLSISYRGLLYKIRQHNITSTNSAPGGALPETGKAE